MEASHTANVRDQDMPGYGSSRASGVVGDDGLNQATWGQKVMAKLDAAVSYFASWRGVGAVGVFLLLIAGMLFVLAVIDSIYGPNNSGIGLWGFGYLVDNMLFALAASGVAFGVAAWLRGREVSGRKV